MGTRSFDLGYFRSGNYFIAPFTYDIADIDAAIVLISSLTTGTFLLLLKHVMFDTEQDAVYFRLRYSK
jgi:hypothetical protein